MAGRLVLIVEDNDRNLKLVRDVLQFRGYETLEARSGEEAVSLAAAHRPDLILMDIKLPDMDGIAALGQLRDNLATATTPVVALTAFAMPEDEPRLLQAGFNGYLAKPIDIKLLPGQVASFLGAGGAEAGGAAEKAANGDTEDPLVVR
jgi:two-component system cell cycle response regulator DivK